VATRVYFRFSLCDLPYFRKIDPAAFAHFSHEIYLHRTLVIAKHHRMKKPMARIRQGR